MENYAYSYPDSGDSSPRSREIDFENPPPSWEEQPQQPPLTHKVKFMVSYGGKIQPRPHDNQLSYIGGETKILSIERSVKFSSIISKLSSLFFSGSVAGAGAGDSNSGAGAGVVLGSFKYQLPGEDLDALISVTNDDDLEHMMHEYDRLLLRSSSKPPAPRLRLFLFPAQHAGSPEPANIDRDRDRDRFVEALNSGLPVPEPSSVSNNMDFLFGLDNKPPVQVVKPILEPDPQIDARIQELNRIQISAVQEEEQQQQQQQAMFRQKSDDNLVVAFGGELYQKSPPTIPMSVQIPAGYWQSPGIEQPQQPPQQQPQPPPHQPQQVYMIHARPPTGMYHAQMMGPPVTGQPGQGYYQVQRVSADPVYREQQPVYSMAPAPSPAPAPVKMAGVMPESTGYAQVAYDSVTGRQVYYAAPGIATAPFRGGVAANDMRPAGGGLTDAEGKVVTKVLPTSAAV